MKVDAKKVLEDLDGNPISLDGTAGNEATVGKVLAFIFQAYKGKVFGGDPMKPLELARSFYKKDVVELDKADFNKVTDVLKEDLRFTPIVLGQVLETLEDAKEDKKGK